MKIGGNLIEKEKHSDFTGWSHRTDANTARVMVASDSP